MKIKEILNLDEKSNIINDLYNNQLYLSEKIPNTFEYLQVTKEIQKLSNNIINELDKKNKILFMKYSEKVNIKEALESEYQFELGFKTAIKIIIEGLV